MKWIRINKLIVDIDKINYVHAHDRNGDFYIVVNSLEENLPIEFETKEDRDEAMEYLMDDLNE